MQTSYIVYYINEHGYQYCVDSGGLKFTSIIENATFYGMNSAISICNYLGLTNKCKDCEIGYLPVYSTVGQKHVITESVPQ